MTKILTDKNSVPISARQAEQQGRAKLAISYSGFEFDCLENTWVLSRNITLCLNFLAQFNEATARDVRETLVYFAENLSSHHTSNLSKQLRLYLEVSETNCFSELGFLAFKNSLSGDGEYKLSVVRGFVRQMRYLGLDSSIDDNVYKLTDQWRLSGNDKGAAVLSFDPEIGPFSSFEFEAVGLTAAHKYAEGVLSTEDYAILQLFKATGRRTEQLASLKIKDCSIARVHNGSQVYVVNIPRAKQRGGRFRSSLKAFGLVKSVAQIIEQHINESILDVQAVLGRKLTALEQKQLPLFLNIKTIRAIKGLSDEDALIFLTSELSQLSSVALSNKLINAANKLKIVSERTEQIMNVNP